MNTIDQLNLRLQ